MPRPADARVLVALAVTLTACPAPTATPRPTPAPSPTATPVSGGTLRILLADDVDSLDPHAAARPSSWTFARALHRGLLTFPAAPYPEGAVPVPDLARAMPVVDRDGTRYTFRLRADVGFGAPVDRPVRARDVRASIERLLRQRVGIAPALRVIRGADAYLAGRSPHVTGVRARGSRRVSIILDEPKSDLPSILAHPQAAIVPAGTRGPRAAGPRGVIGLGPYRIETYRPERSIVLVRNPAWRDDPTRIAAVDRIEATIRVDRSAALQRIVDGGADLLVDPGPPDASPPTEPPGLRVVSVADRCVRALFLNRDRPPFATRALRRAVAAAVRRAPLVGEDATAAHGILPPTVVGHDDVPVIPESLSDARALLREGGRARGFSATLVVGDSARDRREARAIARALARAGIDLTVRTVDPALVYANVYRPAAARPAMGIVTWCADWPGVAGRSALGALVDPRRAGDADALVVAPGGARIRRLLDAAARASDPAAAWAEVDRAVVATAGLVPLTWPTQRVAVSRRVAGPIGTAMLPRGDLTALWIAPR